MFEQRLLDTKRNLQKLAIQSGKSLQDILKCLTESQNSFEGMFNQESINPNEKEEELDLSHLKQTRKGVFEQQMEKNGQGRICLERVMQLIEESILDLNKALTMIMENIVDQMVTKKIYKIRQNFRNLVLNIFGMEEFSFYAFFQSNRIQFQDFSSNFITQIMESDEKYQLLQKIIKSFNHTFEFISLAQNSQMSKLFGLNSNHEKQKYYGIVTHGSPQQEMKASYCLMIKTNKKQTINCVLMKRLINKIIEIAQINTSEESIYITSKIYAKKMLDFLQIIIIQYQSRLKKSLSEYCSLKKQLCFSLSNIIKIILSKVDQNLGNEQPVLALKKLTNQFQEMHYKKIEEIRIYKKYVRENDSILLQFNRVGILQFISGNIDNEYLNNLTSIWEEGKPVLDLLLGKNQKFDSYVKKSLRGTFKTERPIQISDNLKTKITTNGKRIIKISIIIENKQFQKKKEQQNKQNQRANLNDNSNLLKQIQQQNPGVTKQGWLDLFLKNQNHKRGSLETRKSNTYSTPSNSTDLKFKKKSSLVDLKDQFKINLNDIIIDDPTLNILTFNEIQLEEFVIKVLDSLDYFQRLPQQRQKLKSFIRELHDGYQIHSNPFHNFSHGVNVMHMCYLLSSLPANVNILSAKDVFINVFSGLCHDVGHTGFTNAFEIASRSRKAMIYNDKSPLQNFHASMTFQILRKNENNFLCHMDRQQFAKFRKAVIENILYTDIKEHFFLLNSFNDLLKSGKVLGQEDAPILSYMIVHSSDFSGSVREFELCRQWSRRVNMEFSNQYKVQGQLGLPQTPFMKDLDNPLVTSKAEGGFLKVIVYPLYQSLDNLYVSEGIVHKLKKNIQNNIKNWQQINKKQTEKAKALKQVELQTKQ